MDFQDVESDYPLASILTADRSQENNNPFDFQPENSYFRLYMQVGIHIIVQGLVQGVGFRYFVWRHAARLGLSGIVRNLYTGEVEIEAEGDRSLLEEFVKEVKVGPRSAHVRDLKIEWREFQGKFRGFEAR